MGKPERIENPTPHFRHVFRNDGELLQRIRPQPHREIGLNRDVPFHPHLGNLRLDMDNARVETDRLRLEFFDFSKLHIGANTRKEAERKIRHHRAAVDVFDMGHELARLFRRNRDRRTTPMIDAMVRSLFDRIGQNPILPKGEFEEGREHPAPIVVGFQARRIPFQVGHQRSGGKFRHRMRREPLLECLQFPFDGPALEVRHEAPLTLRPLGGDVFCRRVGQRYIQLRGAIIGQRVVEVAGQGSRLSEKALVSCLSLAQLRIGKKRGGHAQAGSRLHGFQFQRGLFSGGFLTALEVLADADTVQPSLHPPGEETALIFKSRQREC